MNATHAIHNVLRNLDILLFNTMELESDWTPQLGQIVFFRDEKGEFVTGSYQGLWNDIRGTRSSLDTRTGEHFEASPYGDTAIRAKCNYATKNEDGSWTVDFLFSYADIADILPHDNSAIEYALLSNQAHAKRVEMDMAS